MNSREGRTYTTNLLNVYERVSNILKRRVGELSILGLPEGRLYSHPQMIGDKP